MRSPGKEFVGEILEGVGAPLLAAGFRRRRSSIYTLDLMPDVLGWVGLNQATRRGDGKLWLNPMVGVRHQGVEAAWSRLAGEAPHRYFPPTLVANVGDLGARRTYREWSFAEGRDNSPAIAAVARAVLTSGLAFMRATTSLQAMRRVARELMVGEYLLFRLPLLFALDGDELRARTTLERDLARTKRRDDDAIQEYRRFAARYLRELRRDGRRR